MLASRDSLHAEIASLRAENDELRETVRYYEDMLKPKKPTPLRHVAKKIGLAASYGAAIKIFSEAETVSYFAFLETWDAHDKCVDYGKVRMCELRKKLAPYDIKIETIYGWGYSISPESQAKLRELIK